MFEAILEELRPEILVRVALTIVSAMILGIEREQHGRAAGLRTILLVSLSACVVMIVSDSFYLQSLEVTATGWHPDPARLAAGALSGMGFLGAGVIIHLRSHIIRGVTTAATLWFATVVGLAFGCGALGIGMLATLLSLVILIVLPRFERRIEADWYSDLTVRLDLDSPSTQAVLDHIENFGLKIKGMGLDDDIAAHTRQVTLNLKFKKRDLARFPLEVSERLRQLPGVRSVRWSG